MRGLLILLPVLSCVFALVGYYFSGNLWVMLAAFFVAGPLVIALMALLLGVRNHDAVDDKNNLNGGG